MYQKGSFCAITIRAGIHKIIAIHRVTPQNSAVNRGKSQSTDVYLDTPRFTLSVSYRREDNLNKELGFLLRVELPGFGFGGG